jgi:hypothetical protein
VVIAFILWDNLSSIDLDIPLYTSLGLKGFTILIVGFYSVDNDIYLVTFITIIVRVTIRVGIGI